MGYIKRLISDIKNIKNNYYKQDRKNKNKIIIELVYTIIIILLVKVPIDFVKELGFDNIKLLENSVYYNLWNILFLIIYLVIIICIILLMFNKINNKYFKNKKEI